MQTYIEYLSEKGIKRFNMLEAVVTSLKPNGCMVRLTDSDEEAFYFGNGTVGDVVWVSILRIDDKKHRIRCVLDSVIVYEEDVA